MDHVRIKSIGPFSVEVLLPGLEWTTVLDWTGF